MSANFDIAQEQTDQQFIQILEANHVNIKPQEHEDNLNPLQSLAFTNQG